MRKRVKLITVLIIAVTMVACALLVINKLDRQIEGLQTDVKNAELTLRHVQQVNGDMDTEINNMNKDSYIIAKARELGYLMPGEIRFVVVNPEVLADDPGAAVVEELTEE